MGPIQLLVPWRTGAWAKSNRPDPDSRSRAWRVWPLLRYHDGARSAPASAAVTSAHCLVHPNTIA